MPKNNERDVEEVFSEELLRCVVKLIHGGLEDDVSAILESLNQVIRMAHAQQITQLEPFDEIQLLLLQLRFIALRYPIPGERPEIEERNFWNRLQKAGLESRFLPEYLIAPKVDRCDNT